MRILNGLKYTILDQFKVLGITFVSVFTIFFLMIVLSGGSVYFGSGRSMAPLVPIFLIWSVIIILFMGVSYTSIYFRTLIQTGFTRLEIFLVTLLTDVAVVISGVVLIASSLLIMLPNEIFSEIEFSVVIDKPVGLVALYLIVALLSTRTLFNVIGLVVNKFNNRFAGVMIGFGVYFLSGIVGRLFFDIGISDFIVENITITIVLYLALMLGVEYLIMQSHNSKPITR